jgi:hypothetical protein
VVQHVCDQVIVLHQGEVVERGTPRKLFSAPSTPIPRPWSRPHRESSEPGRQTVVHTRSSDACDHCKTAPTGVKTHMKQVRSRDDLQRFDGPMRPAPPIGDFVDAQSPLLAGQLGCQLALFAAACPLPRPRKTVSRWP